ncbi:MAG: hypothetical protein IPQ05_19015 [Leptospiraceae bacterium]|nr:hypothetical protein [Leptospiraceae bacterium]
MIDDYISIGKITSTFGLKGFLKVASSGDILPSLKANSTLYLSSESSFTPCRLLEIRKVKNQYVLSIEGCKSIEEAEKLIGSILYFPKKARKSYLESMSFLFIN